MEYTRLLNKIKEKKDLAGLDNSIIISEVRKLLQKKNYDLNKLSEKDLILISKEIRKELRKYSGRFQHSLEEKQWLLENDEIDALLDTHTSTKERKSFYPDLRRIISSLKIKSILDLGCGLNPLALAKKGVKYYASDIHKTDLDLVKSYFNKNGIFGETFIQDLRQISTKLPKADLCILFKVLDIIESKGHKLAEEVISKVESKYYLISFSTKTLSGRPMNHPQRGWIERLLSRLKYNFISFNSKNEIFYLASKDTIPEMLLPQ